MIAIGAVLSSQSVKLPINMERYQELLFTTWKSREEWTEDFKEDEPDVYLTPQHKIESALQ